MIPLAWQRGHTEQRGAFRCEMGSDVTDSWTDAKILYGACACSVQCSLFIGLKVVCKTFQ